MLAYCEGDLKMLISTKILYEALKYYSDLGYEMVDAPLLVDLDVSAHTKPKGVPDLYHDKGKVYVASAEQSFLQLHKEGKIGNGMFMAVTPCYRHERFVSDTHYLMFMKLELIILGVPSEYSGEVLTSSINHAKEFFKQQGHDTTIWGNNPWDISTRDGMELGSYGERKTLDGTNYIFGTGCAFPRISL